MSDKKQCPLCSGQELKESWFGATQYNGLVFEYLECVSCGSLVCTPMPDTMTLQKMYGAEYLAVNIKATEADSPKDPEFVLSTLRKAIKPGLFLDYGCGEGDLLVSAQKLGWDVIGFEYDPKVAIEVASQTGCQVFSDESMLFDDHGKPKVDVLHLGDVIEHLTDLEHQFPKILQIIKPGGLILAQGPLEAGPNLFTQVLKLSKKGKSKQVASMPPYHVILATVNGQRKFFENHGLEQVEYKVTEEDWPAPSRLIKPILSRNSVLWGIRKISQAVSALSFGTMGNRYFYAGRVVQANNIVPK